MTTKTNMDFTYKDTKEIVRRLEIAEYAMSSDPEVGARITIIRSDANINKDSFITYPLTQTDLVNILTRLVNVSGLPIILDFSCCDLPVDNDNENDNKTSDQGADKEDIPF